MGYPEEVLRGASKIKLAVFDVDGVFTDGTIFLHSDGTEHTAFNIRDGLGLTLLQKSAIKLAVISGRASETIKNRMTLLGIEECHMGVSNKRQILTGIMKRHDIELEETAYTGDDLVDIEILKSVGLGIAVPDADPLVKQVALWMTTSRGGAGAVREVCELLLRAKGYTEKDLISWACNGEAQP